MTLFRGLSAFPITPADEDGRVDADDLRGLVHRLVTAEVDSIGVLGSTGTYPYLDREQRRRAVETAVQESGGHVPVMAGIGTLRTDDAVLAGRDAQEAGADAVLLAPVSYTPLTEREVFTHYETVAAALDVPLCVYDNPETTHFRFSTELLAELSAVPNIAAVKNPSPGPSSVADHLKTQRERLAEDFSCGYSGDADAAEALLAGADAWYSVLGGLFPQACEPIVRAARDGEATRARTLASRLQPVWELFAEFGSLRVVHAAARLLGLTSTRPPRPILLPDEADLSRIAATLGELDLR